MRYGPLSGPAESEYDHCNNGCGGVIDHSARPSLFRGFFWTRRVDLTYASDRAEDRRKVMSGRSGEDVTANDRSSFSLKAFQLFEIGVRNGSQLHQIGSLFCAELISWQDVSCQYFIENKGGKSALAEHCIVTTGENHHPGEDQVLLAVIDNSLCGAVERNDQQGCNDTSILPSSSHQPTALLPPCSLPHSVLPASHCSIEHLPCLLNFDSALRVSSRSIEHALGPPPVNSLFFPRLLKSCMFACVACT
jgi:hypothetical protein